MAKRLTLLRVLAAIACAIVPRALPLAAQSIRPNIIVITTDDAGYNDFGFMAELNGYPTDIQTPNLDDLANRSMVLSSGYVNGPICSPSRAALLTGQYQQRFGYEENPGHRDGLAAGQQLISHQLKNLGYTTGAVGKWHMGETDGVNRPLDMGFDEFFGFLWGGRPFFDYTADGSRAIRRGDENIDSQWADEGDATRYDPDRGRYLTDAFGEESAAFINNHADDENPFFLYVALHGPHVPLEAKQSDLDLFADIADPNRRKIAAMTYAVDRAVGDITDALADNGIDDNTIIVFTNDNGGPSTAPYDNGPLTGNKGSLWEGGIRVPFLIKAPGLGSGVYGELVSAIDVLPTLVNAAGGDASQTATDGTDLMPFLSGEVAGDPHELMFWRHTGGRFAVRKGDWKLVRPGTSTYARLHNVADDINEDNYLNSQHPELVNELLRELTIWEATLEKPRWGVFGEVRNRFDHFVFRSEAATASKWSTSGNWTAAGSTNPVRFRAEDAYANAILEFNVRNNADYTSTNDMKRSTNQTFMLNQVRFTGSFAGPADRTGTINGNELLFVKSLDGQLPRIQLDSTSSTPATRFTHRFDNDIRLLDDLEITGDGTQQFVINGDIADYHEPRRVIKSGSSSVTLAGSNTFRGGLSINAGRVNTTSIAGDVINNGGTFAPGPTRALINVAGDYTQHGGVLEIELGGLARGMQFDSLAVSGNITLGGTLQVSLAGGFVPQPNQSFMILDWAGERVGAFDAIELPALASHLGWNTSRLYSTGRISVETFQLPGDLNGDKFTDAADFVLWSKWNSRFAAWQAQFGSSAAGDSAALSADLNADNVVDAADYVLWRKLRPEFDSWQGFFGENLSGNQPPTGDFNADGAIDAADYVLWRKTGGPALDYKTWRASFTRDTQFDAIRGDFNRDGAVDAADYIAWRKTSGASSDYQSWLKYFAPAAIAAASPSSLRIGVPEPTSIALVIAALAAGWLGQRPRCPRPMA
jgi:autotransporter-associated beta strand protein